jgi:hypothetical protein
MPSRSAEMWADPDYARRTREGIRRAWADPVRKAARLAKLWTPERRAEKSRRTLELYRDPDFAARWRVANAEAAPKRVFTEAQRAACAARMSKRWGDPEFRLAAVESTKRMWRDPGRRSALVAKLVKVRNQAEYRAKMSAILVVVGARPEVKALRSAGIRRALADPGTRETRLRKNIATHCTPEYRAAASRKMKAKFENPVFAKKWIERLSKTCKRDTKPERAVGSVLAQSGSPFTAQQPVGRFVADFFVPPSTYVFVDGCYFHGCPLALRHHPKPARDLRRSVWFSGQPHLNLVTFWEHEVCRTSNHQGENRGPVIGPGEIAERLGVHLEGVT